MNPALVSGVTGAAPIWNALMKHVLQGKSDLFPKKPDGVVGAQICAVSGLLPNQANPCSTRFEYFIKGTEPTIQEQIKKNVWIDKTTGNTPKPGITENLELQEKTVYNDGLSEWCLDCQHPENEPIILR
jgi:membrane carboxypeptidase/penicillin-binding protein